MLLQSCRENLQRYKMERALPAGIRSSIRTVEVTPAFAKAVVTTSASEFNLNVLSDSLSTIAAGSGAKFSLTAKEGALIRLPNGQSIKKSFRGITDQSAERLGRSIRDGLLAGDTTAQMRRRLIGRLGFNTLAKTAKTATVGNAWRVNDACKPADSNNRQNIN